ncbi:hypothetical protein IJJ36_00320 [Candidatus Saccharibacteria bacterium]|nr:hypothetical protein [Candidatus Saccharibacteria bacterium]
MHKIKKAVLGVSVIVVFLCLFTWSCISDTLAARSGTQTTSFSANLQPSMSVSISSATVSLSIRPSSGGSTGYSGFTVSSTSNAAYNFFINFTSTDLTSADGHIVPTITGTNPSGYQLSNIDVNHWGVSCSADSNYYCKEINNFLPAAVSPAQIFHSIGNPGVTTTITFRIGAKLDLNTPPGEYITTMNLFALSDMSGS